ncbi:putative MACPF domain-containing protein [Cocos nucifera]|nr:putative MACPF domain-containing protein [Cocos nucifera]
MALRAPPLKAAEIAISSIGLGYDITADIRLKYCKREIPDPYLIELDRDQVQDAVLPGGLCIPNVPKSIKCDKGERMRFRSDVLTFQQVVSISGKVTDV